LSLEAKNWLCNERKCQQKEDDKLKKSTSPTSRDTSKPSSTESANLGSNSNMPNQYARVKNVVKGEDDIQSHPPTHGLLMNSLKMQSKVQICMKNKILIMTLGIQNITYIQALVSIILYIISL
jgi:hypothetical protein